MSPVFVSLLMPEFLCEVARADRSDQPDRPLIIGGDPRAGARLPSRRERHAPGASPRGNR